MNRICLITSAHLSSNPRLVKEADALSEAGYEVTVVAATYSARGREGDKAFATKPWRVEPPLQFGPDAPRGRRFAQLTRHHVARAMVRAGSDNPAVFRASLHPVTPDLAYSATRVEADLYIAHLAALPAAAIAARRRGALYAFDAEDFHLGELTDGPEEEIQRRTTSAIERAYLPGCIYVTAAAPGIADAYAESYGVPTPTVILNVFPRSQAPATAMARGTAEPGPSVYWFSQTIGPDRGLETSVRAIGLAASRPHLYLRGMCARGFGDRLGTLAGELGVADRLHLLPPAPPEEMARLATAHDLGLTSETGRMRNRQIALTNKLFTYLLAGVPTLMSDIGAHLRIADELTGSAFLYRAEDAESLAHAMDTLLLDGNDLARARARAFRLGQDRFNWDIEKLALLDRVGHALGEGRWATPVRRE